MKAVLTLIFVLFIGVAAQAQDAKVDVKVDVVEMTIVTNSQEELSLETKTEVARLYRRANAKVKKALSFTTKRNRAKLA